MRKPRILLVNEASFLHTGYSVYGREVMQRLFATGKYEIAELACYGEVESPRRFEIPWKYYGNLPSGPDDAEYDSQITNQFGEWRFERVCLDFKPDIVIDIRDWWMLEFIERSPFRPYFHWAIMPTVDSAPQQEQWLSTFIDADAVFTYSEYGMDVLKKEGNGKINLIDVASPGANFNIFKPVNDKHAHRQKYGFMDDINIVGTVMRNQARKLYPDLFEAFSIFLKNNPNLANDTFLYLHTSFPDSGWDIPMFLRRFNLGNKVLFTYKCEACGYVFPSFFQDAKTVCQRCSSLAAHLPNTRDGLNDNDLASVYNLFDVYVQYSVCEGFGMPQVEAAACGVPVMAVNYSAMESVLKNLDGTPINVQRMFWDSGTNCARALPDNADFAAKLARFLNKPTQVRQKVGRDSWIKAQTHYNYDRVAKVWEKHIDSVPLRDNNETWDSPPRIKEPNLDIPPNLTNEQFVRWCIQNIWCEPSKLNSYVGVKILRDLNYGEAIKGTGDVIFNEACYLASHARYAPFNHKKAYDNFIKLAERRNFFERLRTGQSKELTPYYIKQAKGAEV